MSKIEISNERRFGVTNIPTGISGELYWHDRTSRRGRLPNVQECFSYVAIFTFFEPFVCSIDAVPDKGGYFLLEDGQAEVTQLIGRFQNENDRSNWVRTFFSYDAQ